MECLIIIDNGQPKDPDKIISEDLLYKKYGDRIYYKDHNDLWTLDLSKFHKLERISTFSFGLFEKK